MKRARSIAKPTGRKPMRIGAILLKEVAYKADDWRVQATWKDPDRKKRWFHNWRHAEEFAAKENRRLDVLKEKGEGRYRFSDAAESFLKRCEAQIKAGTFSPDTMRTYAWDIEKSLLPKWGSYRLEAMTSREIEEWLIDQSTRFSHHTYGRQMIRINQILDHAVYQDMLHMNPLRVKRVKKISNGYKKRVDIPGRSDLEVLREYLNNPRPLKNGRLKWSCLRVLVLLGASCGMRAGEVSALSWDAIDPDTGEIDVRETRARIAGIKPPKTESGYRKIPTTLRAREIINEHAVIYKSLVGKCVGPVLRTRDTNYLSPGMVSQWFREVMQECGLVKPGTNVPKFSFHALRHWCASHWMKVTGDVHQTAKWLGHKNASMTLDIYGHCLDDPEARARFERMPDWLNPAVEIDAPMQHVPRLAAPEEPLEFDADAKQIDQAIECPTIHVPDIAKPWVKPFIMMLANGTPVPEAYDLILPQLEPGGRGQPKATGSASNRVRDELERLKMPTPKLLAARFRDERILALHGQKHQMHDIARMVGCSISAVHRALQSRHKPNANNPLNRKVNLNNHLSRKSQPEHKIQLKLL